MRAILLLTLFVAIAFAVQAKRLILRPLSAPEVYQLLANTGRSDALPQGRLVTRGLTFIGNLTRRLRGGGNVNANDTDVRVTTQEVCFETRNARSLAEAEAVFGSYLSANNRHTNGSLRKRVRSSEVGRILKLKKRKKLRFDEDKLGGNQRIKNLDDGPMSLPGLASHSGTATAATYSEQDKPTKFAYQRASLTSNPTTTADLANAAITMTTNADTEIKKGADGDIVSSSTLSTSPEGAINCVVIKKNE